MELPKLSDIEPTDRLYSHYLGRDFAHTTGGALPLYVAIAMTTTLDWASHASVFHIVGFIIASYSLGLFLNHVASLKSKMEYTDAEKALLKKLPYKSFEEIDHAIVTVLHPQSLRGVERMYVHANLDLSLGSGLIATGLLFAGYWMTNPSEKMLAVKIISGISPILLGLYMIATGRGRMREAIIKRVRLGLCASKVKEQDAPKEA